MTALVRTYAQQRAEVYGAAALEALNEAAEQRDFPMMTVYADLISGYAKEAR